MLALQWCGEPVTAMLRFERSLMAAQPWRLLTTHFVHLGWWHCLLNVGGLLVWSMLAQRAGLRRHFAVLLLVCMLTGVGLLLVPRVHSYAGFSGVLYGLFAWSFAARWRAGEKVYIVGLALLGARIAWQIAGPPSHQEEALIGGTVLGEAHLIGACAGLLMAVVFARPVEALSTGYT